MDFEESIRILGRKATTLESGMNEEATKMALVAPFIRALGYDVFNPEEVVPEYTASTGNFKDARADYAIIKDGEAFAVFECKKLGEPLDVHKSQLEWYFVNSPARIGILTDGNRYIFFSDLEEKRKMDAAPFMDFTLSILDESVLPRLRMLCKDKFEEDKFLTHAEQLKYSREFKRLIAEQFAAPEDEFAKFFISRVWSGKVMQSVLEKLRPVFKAALDQYINDALNTRLKEAMKPSEEPDATANAGEEASEEADSGEDSRIVTTEEEKEGYYLVKSLLLGTVEPKRVCLKDKVNFCNILLDGSQLKPLVRFHFNKRPWRVGFFDGDNKDDRVEIEKLDDIMQYADRIRAAATKYNAPKGNG